MPAAGPPLRRRAAALPDWQTLPERSLCSQGEAALKEAVLRTWARYFDESGIAEAAINFVAVSCSYTVLWSLLLGEQQDYGPAASKQPCGACCLLRLLLGQRA